MRRRLEAEFDGTPEAVREARRFVVSALTDWGFEHLSEIVQICTSEAASNAVRHAGTPFRLRVERRGPEVIVWVEDRGPGQPRVRAFDPEAESGRGMWIISSLSTRWGWEPSEAGKAVWFAVAGDDAGRGPNRL